MNAKTSSPARIAIVGGGFSGASSAVQLVRASRFPLAITIVEARPLVGGGLAHSADDMDHRLNGPANLHYVDPSDSDSFQRWCVERDIVKADPGARVADGSLYPRRKDFGLYVAETVGKLAKQHPGSTVSHVQDFAEGLSETGDLLTIRTRSGRTIEADMVLLATGNALPRLPVEFSGIAHSHPGIVAVPTDLDRVRAIPRSAKVMVLGTGLTALDILSTLIRSGHEGHITAVSRRGLRPASQRPQTAPAAGAAAFHWPTRIDGPIAPFLLEAGSSPTMRKLMRVLRQRIVEVEAKGDLWYTPYDELRDSLWQVWQTVPAYEKTRFLKRLRPWYDNFRFRSPPQNEAMVRQAEATGLVDFRASRIYCVESVQGGAIRVEMRDRGCLVDRIQEFDAVINCTGLDATSGVRNNPFLSSLLDQGLIKIDATGVGLAVDQDCRAIASDGRVLDALRIIGPPTNGTFPDQVGAAFIAAHIRRALPTWLAALQLLHAKSLSPAAPMSCASAGRREARSSSRI